MGTEITCASDSADTMEIGTLGGYEPSRVYLHGYTSGESRFLINPARADFLAAVESELNVRIVPADAIVIERSELPEVKQIGGAFCVDRTTYAGLRRNGAAMRRSALADLALAEHLDTHPPVDEAQRRALKTLLADVGIFDGDVVEDLLATGRIEVKP